MIQRHEVEQDVRPDPMVEYTSTGCRTGLLGLADPDDEPVEWIEHHSECVGRPQPAGAAGACA